MPTTKELAEPSFDFELWEKTFLKSFGPEALVDLKKQPEKGAPGTYLVTPSQTLNLALGIGGLPRGRVIEIYGPESSGKSTLALDILAMTQKTFPKGMVGYLDPENAIPREYAETIGVDLSKKHFAFNQDQEAEKVLDMIANMASAGFNLVVVDSIASLIAKSELEADSTTDSKYGGISKFMSSHLRHVIRACAQTNCTVIYLNQLREKIGMMGHGNPEQTPGGRALKFYASTRLDCRIIGQIKDKVEGGPPRGARIRVTVKKHKVAPPLHTAEYDLIYGQGIDKMADLVEASLAAGILTKSGNWYNHGETKLGNGRDQTATLLAGDQTLQKALTDALWPK